MEKRELAGRIGRHSPLAVGGIITAVTRGLNMAIAEGLQVENEQFAALVPTGDLGERAALRGPGLEAGQRFARAGRVAPRHRARRRRPVL